MSAEDHKARATAALHGLAHSAFELTILDHRPQHPRGGRSVFRVSMQQTHETLILKVYDRPDAAAKQFSELSKLAKTTGTVVKLAFLDQAQNLFAMQDAGHQTLLDSMSRKTIDLATTRSLHWLKEFCRDTQRVTKPFDAKPHLALARRETEHMPKQFQKSAPYVLEKLHKLLAPFDGKPMVHHTSFNDLKPENLCICPHTKRLIGIDYLPGDPQPMERDAAFLLNWMEQYRWRQTLKSRSKLINISDRRNTRVALEALAGHIDPELLAAFRYALTINTWHTLTYFNKAHDLIRTAEVRLGIRHPATVLRPSLRQIMTLLR